MRDEVEAIQSSYRFAFSGLLRVARNDVMSQVLYHVVMRFWLIFLLFILSTAVQAKTIGEYKVLVLLVKDPRSNLSTKDLDLDKARERFFGDSGYTMTRYYDEVSYSKISVSGELDGWIDVENLCAGEGEEFDDDFHSVAQRVIDVTYQDYDYSNFDTVFLITPGVGDSSLTCFDKNSQTGIGTEGLSFFDDPDGGEYEIAAAFMPITYLYNTSTPEHELGHNLGLKHATANSCGSDIFDTSLFQAIDCNPIEYGDPFSVMGPGNSPTHFNAVNKIDLEWFEDYEVLDLNLNSAAGTYQLAPLASDPIEQGSSLYKAIEISFGIGKSYTIEYRQPIGFDKETKKSFKRRRKYNGFLVHYKDTVRFGSKPILLHQKYSGMTKEELDAKYGDSFNAYKFFNAAFNKKNSFYDPENELEIKVVDISKEQITIEVIN